MLVTPVSEMMELIVSPPLPMMRPTMSGATVSLTNLGTDGGNRGECAGIASAINPRMCSRPCRACSSACQSRRAGSAVSRGSGGWPAAVQRGSGVTTRGARRCAACLSHERYGEPLALDVELERGDAAVVARHLE
eukprot:7164326-Prymnesium_polylepis.1